MGHITGLSTSSYSISSMTKQQLIDLTTSNKLLAAGFVNGGGFGVMDGHAYTITSYNSSIGKFHLHNPHGNNHVDVTWEQLKSLQAVIQWTNA